MGLMNVGRTEGSEIIQLFGRGVRLKGHGMTLKRSSQLEGIDRPKHINLLETLNIFGIRADYMRQFKEYLEEEGLPGNEERIEFILPVVKDLQGKKLTSVRIQEGKDFKQQGPKPTLDVPPDRLLRHPVTVNWYPKIQAQQSKGLIRTDDTSVKHEGKLEERHLAFMDIDAIWFELQHFKNDLHVKSDLVEVSPVSLNEGERDFVTDLRSFYDGNRSFFQDRELFLLRNMSRGRGIGFFEAGNFYPDFLLWLLTDDKQYVTFIDPKGIWNLEGPDDPKIRFCRTIKELEARLDEPNVLLNSFIISNTPFQQVRWWTNELSKDEFTKSHVLFQKEDRATYIKSLLLSALSDSQVTVEA